MRGRLASRAERSVMSRDCQRCDGALRQRGAHTFVRKTLPLAALKCAEAGALGAHWGVVLARQAVGGARVDRSVQLPCGGASRRRPAAVHAI